MDFLQSGNQPGWCPYLLKAYIHNYTQIVEVLAAWLDAKVQTASHAEHDLEAHFGCDDEKDLPNAVFQFTDIVIQLHGQLLSHAALKIQEGVGISLVFQTKLLVISVTAFFGSQSSPLCSFVCRMLMILIFAWAILHFIGLVMQVCPYSFDFDRPSY